jgi:SPFH domain / Band 7 family
MELAIGLGVIIVLFAAVLFFIFVLASAVRIVQEYQRGVVFRLGRVREGAKGPGLIFLIPIADRMVKVDLRTVSMGVPPTATMRPGINLREHHYEPRRVTAPTSRGPFLEGLRAFSYFKAANILRLEDALPPLPPVYLRR